MGVLTVAPTMAELNSFSSEESPLPSGGGNTRQRRPKNPSWAPPAPPASERGCCGAGGRGVTPTAPSRPELGASRTRLLRPQPRIDPPKTHPSDNGDNRQATLTARGHPGRTPRMGPFTPKVKSAPPGACAAPRTHFFPLGRSRFLFRRDLLGGPVNPPMSPRHRDGDSGVSRGPLEPLGIFRNIPICRNSPRGAPSSAQCPTPTGTLSSGTVTFAAAALGATASP